MIIDKGHRNSRRLYASVEIAAPLQVVWEALTDYEGLGTFIPGQSVCRQDSGKLAGGVRSACVAEMLCLAQWCLDVTRQLAAALPGLTRALREFDTVAQLSVTTSLWLELAC